MKLIRLGKFFAESSSPQYTYWAQSTTNNGPDILYNSKNPYPYPGGGGKIITGKKLQER